MSMQISIADEAFRAVGLMVSERNWLQVYPYMSWGGKELPVFQQGQTFAPAELALKQVRLGRDWVEGAARNGRLGTRLPVFQQGQVFLLQSWL